ncbi:NAD(P)-dependent oxidoreductase [Streptosporangium vulgare]|uniref:NAD-dependent epimerase/dehydratase family protein n=1 Tax=Streptosporangium vulgare TaxID=46190 RepID=UPI0031CEB3D5
MSAARRIEGILDEIRAIAPPVAPRAGPRHPAQAVGADRRADRDVPGGGRALPARPRGGRAGTSACRTGGYATWSAAAPVLVIGAEGRIGGMLVAGLAGMGPGRLLTAGLSPDAPVDGAEHRVLDIRDRERVSRLIAGVRPDVVFHLATRPVTGTAERDTHDSVCADVLGTRHVVDACAEARVGVLVVASAEESLLLYAHDVRSASKRGHRTDRRRRRGPGAGERRHRAPRPRHRRLAAAAPLPPARAARGRCCGCRRRPGDSTCSPRGRPRNCCWSRRPAPAPARRPCTPSGTWPCRRPPWTWRSG